MTLALGLSGHRPKLRSEEGIVGKTRGRRRGGWRRKEKPLAPRSKSLSRGDKQSVAYSKPGANDLLIPL